MLKGVEMSTPLERAEAPIHELTQKAILEVLEKYPRKKTVYKEFCTEYEILEIEEMSEVLALEILDIMDNRSYIQVVRAKKQYEIEQTHLRLVECVSNYLSAHSEEYIILTVVPDCWLVAKKVSLIVYSKNSNSAFQPYETNDKKEYFIVVAIKIAEEFTPDEIMSRFITRGCKMIRIYDELEVHRKIGEIK